MNLTLHVWRQKNANAKGRWFGTKPETSTQTCLSLRCWMLSTGSLIGKGEEPIAFDHDCREGICGSCGMMINGIAHGPQRATAACQLHMRHFKDGDTIFYRTLALKSLSGAQGSGCGSQCP